MHCAPHIGHLMREAISRSSQVIKRPSEAITEHPTSGTSSVMNGRPCLAPSTLRSGTMMFSCTLGISSSSGSGERT